MRVLYYDCFCGISGDMNLAALIDLGVPREYLIKEISKLGLDSEYEIKFETSAKKGITGTRVDVILKNEHTHHEHSEEQHNHSHIHDHSHGHIHGHNHENINKIDHEHQHRNLKDIEEIINSSTLDDNIKKMSIEMFMKVAVAEAKVHGKSLNEVHFHEVGATDSIVDIVGAAIAIDYLKVDKIMASTVQVGGGFVKCAHGLMPVPAPATAEILKNIPMNTGIVQFETTTPTGAAILSANVKEFTDKIDFSIEKIGYGIGHRDLDIPNILRVYIGVKEEHEEIQEQYIIETNIDDMNPELYGYIEEKLFEIGALDVYKTPIFMKKGRPAIKLSILVNNNCEKEVLDVIFKESTSIGVRKYKVEKIMLTREFSKVKTKYGEVTIKSSFYKGELVKYKAEYEDCRNIAIENNIPIEKVYKEVNKTLQENVNG
ncbi:nickel pincer cofactor biosynthesis protein LarC [Clostridium sp. 'White wine YQ']|uniref:nickel pincer cofactor biosynthesis protein LarC n=1 Tax=Clostridium sp. 'White wine YQ' TaxID=3027474 RepID=UPI0023656425|nr:nickel pincer cofactor biosynthesis protein LarC [Clostridium sp. 'White wine YQ']MDD7792840.1 nickel pincer cofactor biosynthesis protein LarC [Clostridium sp. 'White wine YQ']